MEAQKIKIIAAIIGNVEFVIMRLEEKRYYLR